MHASYFPYKLHKIKKYEGSYDKSQKNQKKSSRNIKNSDAPNLKLTTNGIEVFVNAHWASLCEIDVLLNINLMLLLMHKYCN